MQAESPTSSSPSAISILDATRAGAIPRPQWPPPEPLTVYKRPKYPPFASIIIRKFSFQKLPEKTALFFDIDVTTSESTYSITRRFAYLKLLHEWVSINIPGVQPKPLPTKIGTFFGSRETEAKKRMTALQAFMDQISVTKWFSNLVFIRKFFSNTSEVPLDVPEYPDSGLLYVHVVESRGLSAFGPNRLKIMPTLSFGKGAVPSAFVTKQSDPSHNETKIYQEVVHTVARRSLQSLLILVVDTHPQERPRGPFSEIDLCNLVPFQMYEFDEIFKVKMDPLPSVKLMLQWVPMTFEKPIKMILPSARIHFHNSTVAPGEVLRGEFILSNDIPRPCTGVVLNLRCRQTADYQEIREVKRPRGGPTYKSVRHTASVELAHARRVIIPQHDPIKNGSAPPILPAGFYVWPFEFAVPVDSPASFQVPESIMVQNKNSGTFWSLDAAVGIPNFPQPSANVKVLQVLGIEDERRIVTDEMSTLGEELILNGVGFRIVSRDGWIWNHGELRNLTIGLRAAQVKEIHVALVRLQGHAMVYANQPRLKKKPRAGSDPAANNNDLTTVEDVDEFEEDAQYGVSDAINKQVGEFNFEQRVVQGRCECHRGYPDDVFPLFGVTTPRLQFVVAGRRETTAFPIPIYISAKPTKTLLYPVPPQGVSEHTVKTSGFGLPHMPFHHFNKYPPQPNLGRTPLMPPYSWFYPLTLEVNYPLSPTNLVTLPSSTFHHARVIAPELPTLEVLMERLRAIAPTDGAVKDLLDEVEAMSEELALADAQAAQAPPQAGTPQDLSPPPLIVLPEDLSKAKPAVPAALLRVRGETLMSRAAMRHRGESIAEASLRAAADYVVVPGDSSSVRPRDRTSAEVLRRTLSKQSLAVSASSSEIVLETQERSLAPPVDPAASTDNPSPAVGDDASTTTKLPTIVTPAPVVEALPGPSRLSIMVSEALREQSPVRRNKEKRGSVPNPLAPQQQGSFSIAQRILMAAQGRSSRESIRQSMYLQQYAHRLQVPESPTTSPKVSISEPVAIAPSSAASSAHAEDPAPWQ